MAIETSGPICSVALQDKTGRVWLQEETGERVHGEKITLFMQALFQESGLSPADLEAVAVSSGPGSYTGLRVGLSAAKGLCMALSIPLIQIPTQESLLQGMLSRVQETHIMCPVITARKEEIYFAMYNSEGKELRAPQALELSSGNRDFIHPEDAVAWGGPGLELIQVSEIWKKSDKFIPDIQLTAALVLQSALSYFQAGNFANLASAEPLYVKPVRITSSARS